MSTSSKNSLTEKNHDLPYPDAETEYNNVADEDERHINHNDFDDHNESIKEYEYEISHKPHRKPFYRRKKVIITCLVGTVIFLAIFIPLLILVIIPKVAQSLLNSSSMEIMQLNMTNPGETALTVSVSARVGGIPKIFSADLEFTDRVLVHWQNQAIGSMNLDPVKVKGGKGDIMQGTGFNIENKEAFAAFAKDM
ncbi:hypothetical protein BGZ65_002939, partial [Modicella reniformis]